MKLASLAKISRNLLAISAGDVSAFARATSDFEAKMNRSRGIHSLPNDGATVEWLTPPEIVNACGEFDLDPCAHPRQFYKTAKRMIAPPEDGLAEKWQGRVWLNPPYGGQMKTWLGKLAQHNNGIALVPSRTEVEAWFWPFIWEAANAILFIRGRLYFYRPDGTTKGNAGHGSVLAAYGERNADTLMEAGIAGRFFRLR